MLVSLDTTKTYLIYMFRAVWIWTSLLLLVIGGFRLELMFSTDQNMLFISKVVKSDQNKILLLLL